MEVFPGGNIAIDDGIGGAWYALNGDANGVAGDDLKVLVGQFTTTGELSGQLYVQVFIEGDGGNEFRDTFSFGGPDVVEGCTDPTACNFNADAEPTMVPVPIPSPPTWTAMASA